MSWKSIDLPNWGRNHASPCLAARPERLSELRAALTPPEGRTLLARGAGRSYGDVCQNTGGAAVVMTRLNRILSFDEATGEIVVEPGVTFAGLVAALLPQGWIAPTSPGTSLATIGGAVANDVHGKNHHLAGSFGDHVLWLDMLGPDGQTTRLTPDAPLFAATVGGLGLTGVIAAVCFRMVRVASNAVRVRSTRITGLEGFMAAFAAAEAAPWSVGWIDALASGGALGRGVMETASVAESDVPAPTKRRSMPVDLPGFVLNPLSVRAFNAWYWRRAPLAGREAVLHHAAFLYPLDAIADWNRLYGKRGFHQFQCVLPAAASLDGLRLLLTRTAQSGAASFLAVIKAMGPSGRGLLSFAMPGMSLALDLPHKPGTMALLGELERMTLDHGGRIYLAKDSALSREGFRRMYPTADRFMALRRQADPQGRLRSDMAERLGLA